MARTAIAEDLEYDPEHKRQRGLVGYLLGIAINALKGHRPCWEDARDEVALAARLQDLALTNGLVAFDEWHHAPMCKANNWSRMSLPEGPCTCGAKARRIR